ncbi:MAG: NADH-quinone oxidoreductase subunit J [Anaerolineales bacterium]|nr:NADH-quinone oxidoreductase subunit J [Anaerolineales bacterium]
MTTQYILFFSLALIAVVSALGMLLSRNAIYAALYLVLNFAAVAVFFLLLHAPFIAIAQVSVYAGAIMVLFLFVIMLLGAEQVGPQQAIAWQRPVAVVLGLVLLVEVGYILLSQFGVIPPGLDEIQTSFGSPVNVGGELFTTYLLPFEITSVLLLVAIIGAIVLTKIERNADQERK